MIKCIAVDDEPMALDILSEYIQKTGFLDLKATFRDTVDALNFLHDNSIDLLFLDINMPDLNGIQLIQSLPQPSPAIIFCTAYSEYAIESYNYEAVDYLLKPIQFERFIKAALKAKKKIDINSQKIEKTSPGFRTAEVVDKKYLMIKSGTELHKIFVDQIIYIEASGNYIILYFQDQKIMSLMSLKDVLELLPKQMFFRIHKSYIISFDHLKSLEYHEVKVGDVCLPVGGAYRESFRSWIKEKET